MFVDSHRTHRRSEFDSDRDEVIQRSRDAGVSAILNVVPVIPTAVRLASC